MLISSVGSEMHGMGSARVKTLRGARKKRVCKRIVRRSSSCIISSCSIRKKLLAGPFSVSKRTNMRFSDFVFVYYNRHTASTSITAETHTHGGR